MSNLLLRPGISDRLYQATGSWFSELKGGLAIVSLFVCVCLAMTGGFAPGTFTMGTIAVPGMYARNYDKHSHHRWSEGATSINLVNNHKIKAYLINQERELAKRRCIMKKMTVRELSHGRKTTLTAQKTYQDGFGEWVAEVDRGEYCKACSYVCQGVENCVWEKLQVQADQDDDGKVYRVLSK
ncbi:Tripartite ATP-independent transporter, DctM component [Desulforhopalus singaporensis]|uniref:Tripartite ATP-independent transporter, DctM component n=2 Tax=Desulforhopalus singaporensis TaxID=91360 RepID=A0A1H0NQG6_9BACT|nr:Tripartite ATP-independent transporter, DctM component [Desulforhopalus singaporensis]